MKSIPAKGKNPSAQSEPCKDSDSKMKINTGNNSEFKRYVNEDRDNTSFKIISEMWAVLNIEFDNDKESRTFTGFLIRKYSIGKVYFGKMWKGNSELYLVNDERNCLKDRLGDRIFSDKTYMDIYTSLLSASKRKSIVYRTDREPVKITMGFTDAEKEELGSWEKKLCLNKTSIFTYILSLGLEKSERAWLANKNNDKKIRVTDMTHEIINDIELRFFEYIEEYQMFMNKSNLLLDFLDEEYKVKKEKMNKWKDKRHDSAENSGRSECSNEYSKDER